MPEINTRGSALVLPCAGDSFESFILLTVGAVVSHDPRGYMSFAQSLSRGRLRIGPQLALSGLGITDINAALPAFLATLPASQQFVFYKPGVNDIGGSMTSGDWLTAHAAGRAMILASGRVPICTTLPQNTTAPANVAGRILWRLTVNAALRALRSSGVLVFDADDIIQLADGTIPTQILGDGTHFATKGAFRWGKKLLDFLEPLLPQVCPTEWAPVGKTGMRIPNGVLNGGTTAPTSWTLTGGTGSKVAADVNDPDQTGWAQCVITSAGGRAYGGFQATLASVAGPLVAYAECEVIVPDDASVINVSLEVRSFAGGNPQRQCLPGVNAGEFYPAGTHRMVLITPPVTFTAPEMASSFIYLTGSVADLKTATFKFRRVGDLDY